MEYQATLRIVLLNPPNGVLYCLEDDNERFVSATMSTGDDIVFEFQTVVKPNQRTKANWVDCLGVPYQFDKFTRF